MKPFAVKVENEAVSESLQREAFAAGYEWGSLGRTVSHTTAPYLEFGGKGPGCEKTIFWSPTHWLAKELVSIPEAFRRLREQITPPKPATKTVPVSSYIAACAKGCYAEDAAEAMGLTYDQFRRFEAEFNRRLAQHAGLTGITITAE